jgi:uncharacterized protein (TIGR02453 family)
MPAQNAHIPKSGFDFLKKLKRNNNRDWFQSHKQDFENNLKLPLAGVLAELEQLMGGKAAKINFNPQKAIFRMNRDVRFSSDKSPYKTHIAAAMSFKNRSKKDEFPLLYLHVEPGRCLIGGGLYMPSGEQIRKIREMILKDPKRFQSILNAPKVKKYFGGLTGEKLKTAPKGIDKNHPHIDLLKWKQFVFIKNYKDADFQNGNLAKKIQNEYLAMLPLIEWLEEAQNLW